MRRPLRRLLIATLVATSLAVPQVSTAPVSAAEPTPELDVRSGYDNEHLLVKFKDSASDSSIEKIKDKNDLIVDESLAVADVERLKIEDGDNPVDVARELRKNSNVEYAEPDYHINVSSISNDTSIDNSWGLDNYGQSVQGQTGISNIDINAPAAWNQNKGQGIIVAVLDEGIEISHPEFSGRIWTNDDCFSDGVDHDGNGKINDCNGWDFFHNDKTVFDPADGDDHGTHVAGIIAANLNNNLGIAGVAPSATIMPLKFLGPSGGNTSDAILAIQYAKDNGALIVNCSWGGGSSSQALKDAMINSGLIFTSAAGNSGQNMAISPQYPAAWDLPNQISVAAIDNRGQLAGFSNYGGATDVGAPGVDILSPIPKRMPSSLAVERNGSIYKSAFWGFGLEDVVGASARRNLLVAQLGYLGASATNSPITIVDDDESIFGISQDTASFYSAALSSAGYSDVNVVEVARDADGPNAAALSGRTVIWETGYATGSTSAYTLTNNDLSALTTFLNGGGRLLMAGADAIWRNETTSFVMNHLGVDYIEEGDERTDAQGQTGTSFAGMTLNLSGTQSPRGNANQYKDTIEARGSGTAETITLDSDPDYSNAYQYKNGTSMAAPFVAGIAALVKKAVPGASAAAVVTAIKGSVRTLSSLQGGKTRTGGTVDAIAAINYALSPPAPPPPPPPAPAPTPTNQYRFVAADGGIFTYGGANFSGSAGGQKLNSSIVAMASTASSSGYWLVAADGGIFNYGVPFHGSAGGTKLNQPIVGMAATPSGNGYWLVARDGGIFNYGGAGFKGGAGGIRLNKPIVGMASTPSGNGYWLVASDGGIFNYGDAGFYGSAGGGKLNQPIVGMTSTHTGGGYWLVASDGGIFNYGDAGFSGSAGWMKLNQPIVGMSL